MSIKTCCQSVSKGFNTYLITPVKKAGTTVGHKIAAIFRHVMEKAKAFYHFCFDRKNRVAGGFLFGGAIALTAIAAVAVTVASIMKPILIPLFIASVGLGVVAGSLV